MRINNNIQAVNTHRQLGISALDGSKSMEKLSSGFRINRAGDDAAGLAISEKMRGQIRGLNMASKNSSDTISLIQTAEGALAETHAILQRMRELAVQSANDTNTDADRMELQAEVTQLKAEIDRIGNTTEFNTKKLLEGSATGVKAEIAGTLVINNNSAVVIDPVGQKKMSDSISADKSWAFDGAYMLVKTNQTSTAAGQANNLYNANDFKMIAPNGVEYAFRELAANTLYDSNTLNGLAENMIIAGDNRPGGTPGSIEIDGAITTEVTITIGNFAGLDEGDVDLVARGSTLTVDSEVELNAGSTLRLDINGKTTTIEYVAGDELIINDIVVAKDKSFVLDDGSILKNDGAGAFTVTQGSIKLAEDLDSTGNAASYTLATDSTIMAGSTLVSGAVLESGTVIMNKENTENLRTHVSGGIHLDGGSGNGTDTLRFGGNATNELTFEYDGMKVADTFTFVFAKYQAATNNLADSLMSQIGANSGQTTFLSISDMRCKALGVSDVDIATKWGAAVAIETVNNALMAVSHQRSLLGAVQNRLEHTIKNLDVASENLQAAESRIRDVDMAKEIMQYTKTNILQQASQAMLAQANQAPQSVLQLLR